MKKKIPETIIGVAVSLFFLFITFTGVIDFTDPIEMKSFDFRMRLAARSEKNPDIELVVISEEDLSEFGHWPWSRDILAQGINNLAAAGAKVIACDILISKPEEGPGLRALKELKESYDKLGLVQKGPGFIFYRELSQAEAALDHDVKLHDAIKKAGNVVLPVFFDLNSGSMDKEAPYFIIRDSYKGVRILNNEGAPPYLIRAKKILALLPSMAEVAASTGFNNIFPDLDGNVRSQIHALGYLQNILYPSYPVAIIKTFYGLKDGDITFSLDGGIGMKTPAGATAKVPVINRELKTLISWNSGPGKAFHRTPFSAVYKNRIQNDLFMDKIVIIGPTARGVGKRFATPVSGRLPEMEVMANSVENILNQRFYSRPDWVFYLESVMLIVFGFFISYVLPRVKPGLGAITTIGLLLAWGTTGMTLLFSNNIWLRVSPPMILLIAGYLLIGLDRYFMDKSAKKETEADSIETNKLRCLSFQQQGMLDLALQKFRDIPLDEEGARDLLYNLGLDYERKRQFSKALAVYNLIQGDGHYYKDIHERILKLKGAEAIVIFNGGREGRPENFGLKIRTMDTKPRLGRYKVIDELGRGAMGIVYKGEDPKTHRTVAIKTVRLSDLPKEALDIMKERVFREAEPDGPLIHPNIVTIYDAGEEDELAYIAMEFLKGVNLGKYTGKETLLPLREILSIAAQVADALDFAHARGMVHRDIKPANIMLLDQTHKVKVADFGIAQITASLRTSTGIVTGTPYYMSPEQISGEKVDARSDIFSLGVVLFELLCGQKPFPGEDMTSLMYRITKERHPSIRNVNPNVPAVVEKIIDKALEKEQIKRYQKAGRMAEHLKRVIAKIDEIQRKKRPYVI